MKKNFSNEINVFLKHLKATGYAISTINGYYFGLKDFFNYLKNNKIDLTEFRNQDILNFKKTLSNKCSAQTINSKIYAIKKYIKYLSQEKNINIDCNIDIIKVKNKKDLIPIKDINKLLDYIDKETKNNFIRERDKLIVKMLYYTGIKTKELLKIKKEDVINNILKLENKIITLNKLLIKDLDNYINHANIQDAEYIFFNYSPANPARKKFKANKPLTEKSAQDIFNKYKSIINSKLSIIDLRNSYVRNLKRKYVELKFNKINSHKIIHTNNDYLKLS
jgi:site-specific recombinase XerD